MGGVRRPIQLDRGDLRLVAVAGDPVGRQPLHAQRAIPIEAEVDEDVGLAHGAQHT